MINVNDRDKYGRPIGVPFREEHVCVVISTRDLAEADHDLHQLQRDAGTLNEPYNDVADRVKKARAILRRLHDEGFEQSRLVQVGGAPCTARFVDVIGHKSVT